MDSTTASTPRHWVQASQYQYERCMSHNHDDPEACKGWWEDTPPPITPSTLRDIPRTIDGTTSDYNKVDILVNSTWGDLQNLVQPTAEMSAILQEMTVSPGARYKASQLHALVLAARDAAVEIKQLLDV